MICVSISHIDQLTPVIESGAELIELRFDLLGTLPGELYPNIPVDVKTIATCRPGSHSEMERIRLLTSAIELGAAYVDLELESEESFVKPVLQVANDQQCHVIFSYHNFEATPGRVELRSKFKHCYNRGGALAKIATQVCSTEDILTLNSLYDLPGRKVILGMGDLGRITLITGPYLGSEFTFASPGSGNETAPGQLDSEQLNAIYKVINAS
jgi:3-dehydroquinate dehydratase-1